MSDTIPAPAPAGCLDLDQALAECEAMIGKVAWKFRHAGRSYGDVEDLAQEGRIAVLRAYEHHDGSRPFKVFAAMCVYNHLRDVVRSTRGRHHQKPQLTRAEPFDAGAGEDENAALAVDGGQEGLYVDHEERRALAGAVAELPARHRAMMEALIEGVPVDEIGRRVGVSEPRIYQIRRKVIERVRKTHKVPS